MLLSSETVIDKRFQVISELGRGGMGEVYKATQLDLGRIVALKVLSAGRFTEEARLRLQREALAMSSLHHSGVVSVFGYGEWQGLPYIVMEYVDGVLLSALLKSNKPLGVERTLRLLSQLCAAIDYTHAAGIVHRDLKPDNIILLNSETEHETIKIIDLGLARILPQSGKNVVTLTQTGCALGSVAYMSPEQCVGRKADGRADVYSLGVIMHQCLTGQLPFTSENSVAAMMAHTNEQPPYLATVNKEADRPGLQAIIFKAMAKMPNERYASANAMRDDIETCLSGRGQELTSAYKLEAKAGALNPGLERNERKSSVVAVRNMTFALLCFAALFAVPFVHDAAFPTSLQVYTAACKRVDYKKALAARHESLRPLGRILPTDDFCINPETAHRLIRSIELNEKDGYLPEDDQRDEAFLLCEYFQRNQELPNLRTMKFLAGKLPKYVFPSALFSESNRAGIAKLGLTLCEDPGAEETDVHHFVDAVLGDGCLDNDRSYLFRIEKLVQKFGHRNLVFVCRLLRLHRDYDELGCQSDAERVKNTIMNWRSPDQIIIMLNDGESSQAIISTVGLHSERLIFASLLSRKTIADQRRVDLLCENALQASEYFTKADADLVLKCTNNPKLLRQLEQALSRYRYSSQKEYLSLYARVQAAAKTGRETKSKIAEQTQDARTPEACLLRAKMKVGAFVKLASGNYNRYTVPLAGNFDRTLKELDSSDEEIQKRFINGDLFGRDYFEQLGAFYLMRGRVYQWLLDDTNKAELDFLKAAMFDPQDRFTKAQMVEILLDENKVGDAIEESDRLSHIFPRDRNVGLARARALMCIRHWQEALRTLTIACPDDVYRANDGQELFYKVRIYTALGRTKDARELSEAFAAKYEGSSTMYGQKIVLDLSMGDFDAAVQDAHKAQELIKKLGDPVIGEVAAVNLLAGNYLEAKIATDGALRINTFKQRTAMRKLILRMIVARALHDDAKSKVFAEVAGIKLPDKQLWPMPILSCLDGKISRAQLWSSVRNVGEQTDVRTYLGLLDLATDQKARALEHFKWVVNSGNPSVIEYDYARIGMIKLDHAAK
jgi:tRNA A-37 threonylcarbamoyl transferase component Bud32